MKPIQYTIRNVPKEVDMYLRKLAILRGQSLNQVVVSELSERAGVGSKNQTLLESLDWFIGAGMDDATLKALEDIDKEQKDPEFIERERRKMDEIIRQLSE